MEVPPIPPGYAAYPREPMYPGSYGPAPRRVRIEALVDAFNLVKANLGYWIGASVVMIGVYVGLSTIFSFVTAMVSPPQDSRDPFAMLFSAEYLVPNAVGSALTQIVVGCLGAGMMHLGLRQVRGEPYSFTTVFDFRGKLGYIVAIELILVPFEVVMSLAPLGAKWLMPDADFFTLIWVNLGITAVLAALVGVVHSFLAFSQLLVIDRGMTVGDAFKTSIQTASRKIFGIYGLLFLVATIALIGLCACVVGIIFTLPIYYATRAVLYNDFFRPEQPASLLNTAEGQSL